MEPTKQRALVVSSVFAEDQMAAKLGREAYSYRFVFRAFEPLLRRWGPTIEVTRPESRLDHALWRVRRQNLEPIHLSFLPLHMTYLTHAAPNIAVPAWEFRRFRIRTFKTTRATIGGVSPINCP